MKYIKLLFLLIITNLLFAKDNKIEDFKKSFEGTFIDQFSNIYTIKFKGSLYINEELFDSVDIKGFKIISKDKKSEVISKKDSIFYNGNYLKLVSRSNDVLEEYLKLKTPKTEIKQIEEVKPQPVSYFSLIHLLYLLLGGIIGFLIFVFTFPNKKKSNNNDEILKDFKSKESVLKQEIEKNKLKIIDLESQLIKVKQEKVIIPEIPKNIEKSIPQTILQKVIKYAQVPNSEGIFELENNKNDDMLYQVEINENEGTFEFIGNQIDIILSSYDKYLDVCCTYDSMNQNAKSIKTLKKGKVVKIDGNKWKTVEKALIEFIV